MLTTSTSTALCSNLMCTPVRCHASTGRCRMNLLTMPNRKTMSSREIAALVDTIALTCLPLIVMSH